VARVAVVGGGFAGMAAAARLAKLRHEVVLVERGTELGGALRPIRTGGFCWDGGAASTTLPAALRDLFRKSGRPLERELDLAPVPTPRRHHFPDGSVLDLPMGSRGAQMRAIAEFAGPVEAERWGAYVVGLHRTWEVVRTHALERPYDGCQALSPSERKALGSRTSLRRRAHQAVRDERLRAVIEHPTRLAGSHPHDAPSYVGVEHYLERTFGVWRPGTGGMAAVVDALRGRLKTRRVDVRLGTSVERLTPTSAECSDGTRVATDLVVVAIDPRAAFELLDQPMPRQLGRLTPADPPALSHLGLSAGAPDLPFETVLHGDPLLVVRGESLRTCTVLCRGATREDVLDMMARRGLDLRAYVVTRVDRSPADIVAASGGSPYGLAWRGHRSAVQRLRTEVDGLHFVGASAFPGAGIPLVGLGVAQVSVRIGRA
jgi:phytoene dehydrogenase-like protein